MTENPLLSFFPETDVIKEIRPNQKEALDKIFLHIFPKMKAFPPDKPEQPLNQSIPEILSQMNKLTEEKPLIISSFGMLCAPTGSGKSVLGITLFNYFSSFGRKCLYTSPLNNLVDQIEKYNFHDIFTIKGRAHYRCLAGAKNCAVGWCQKDRCPSSKRLRKCKKEPYGACKTCVCRNCIYKVTFSRFKNSEKGNTNFTMFLLGAHNSPDVIVIDECDMIEEFIRNHYRLTIPKLIKDPDFRHHVEPLKEYLEELTATINAINPYSESTPDEELDKRKALEKLSEKIIYLLSDVEENKEPWVISVDLEKKKTRYEPITINRFIDPLLKNTIVFMMSATPPVLDGYSRVEVDSIFPVETRQWSFIPLGRMSFHYRDRTIPKVAWWLSQLKGKTLVHCVSYATAQRISDALRILNVYPLLQVNHNGGDEHTTTRYDAVNAFVTARDPNKIMLSVKLDRGVDFHQPDILNNVIAVVPYPNPTEPLTKAKNRLLGKVWQNEEMARTIAQMMGRIFRNEKLGIYNGKPTPKRGYIVDTNFGNFYFNNKKLFPKWFREAQLLRHEGYGSKTI